MMPSHEDIGKKWSKRERDKGQRGKKKWGGGRLLEDAGCHLDVTLKTLFLSRWASPRKISSRQLRKRAQLRPLDRTGRDYEKTRPNKGGNWKQKRQVSLGKRYLRKKGMWRSLGSQRIAHSITGQPQCIFSFPGRGLMKEAKRSSLAKCIVIGQGFRRPHPVHNQRISQCRLGKG